MALWSHLRSAVKDTIISKYIKIYYVPFWVYEDIIGILVCNASRSNLIFLVFARVLCVTPLAIVTMDKPLQLSAWRMSPILKSESHNEWWLAFFIFFFFFGEDTSLEYIMLFSDKYTNLENLNCGWSNFGSEKREQSLQLATILTSYQPLWQVFMGKKNSIESSILVFRFSLMKLLNPWASAKINN